MTSSLKMWFAAGALAMGALAAGVTEPANAAGYIKLGDIKGEVEAVSWSGDRSLWLTTKDDPQAIGLLLPAVQKVRAAAPRPRSVSSFELVDGGKGWTIYDAQVEPTRQANRVKVVYRCKDWRDLRTGETGSDCAERAGKR